MRPGTVREKVSSQPRYLEFADDSPAEVVAVMEALTSSHAGWINFQPAVDVEDLPPPPSPLFAFLSARGPDVPLATWTPPSAPGRRRPDPPMIGLQHGAGTRAKARLAELGHGVPEGWVVVQDHSRKGLVVAVPPTVAHAQVVGWLLGAAEALSPVPLRNGWRAAVYEG